MNDLSVREVLTEVARALDTSVVSISAGRFRFANGMSGRWSIAREVLHVELDLDGQRGLAFGVSRRTGLQLPVL